MTYFLTVIDVHNRPLRLNEPHRSLDSALQTVCESYLKNPRDPWQSNAFCAIKNGRIYRIKIIHDPHALDLCLPNHIHSIEITSAAQYLDAETYVHKNN